MTTYSIAEAAERSGFPASTLRYYEDIGLVAPAERTAAGYRRYDDQALARLAFVARSKQLGLSLEEVAEVLPAWEGDRCEPVQARLRDLVDGKVADAHRRIAELVALTADLQRAQAVLHGPAPDGPCDASCACAGFGLDPTSAPPVATPVPLGRSSDSGDDTVAIACSLDATAMGGRLEEWQHVLGWVDHREPLDGGVRLVLRDGVPLGEVAVLAGAEQTCCSFFSFTLTVDRAGAALEVRAPAEATDLVAALFGDARAAACAPPEAKAAACAPPEAKAAACAPPEAKAAACAPPEAKAAACAPPEAKT
jgi:DNA-binding transcriptional MerR regulator